MLGYSEGIALKHYIEEVGTEKSGRKYSEKASTFQAIPIQKEARAGKRSEAELGRQPPCIGPTRPVRAVDA